MLRYFAQSIVLVCVFNVLTQVLADGSNPDTPVSPTESPDQSPDQPDDEMEAAIREFEPHAPEDEAITISEYEETSEGDKYQQYIDTLEPKMDRIIELLTDSTNAYKFIEAKGVEKVILRHIVEYAPSFRIKILTIIQQLFTLAPKATSNVLPMHALDNLLEIYEDEDTLAIKGQVVDILYAWLPGNVRAQARVMKTKGLDAFYDQMHRLDASIVETKLKLFSKILKEHVRVRAEAKQDTKTDLARLNLYKRIGLIERMSTPRVCIGLMNIFSLFVPTQRPYMTPIIDLLIEVQPYCSTHFVKQTRAAQFFRVLEQHVKEMNEQTKLHYKNQGFNVTEIDEVVGKYVEAMKATRDEF